jgi:hypothetical protein
MHQFSRVEQFVAETLCDSKDKLCVFQATKKGKSWCLPIKKVPWHYAAIFTGFIVLGLGLLNVLSVAQSIDIMATLVLMFYYYMRQIQSLSVDSSMTWMKKYMD